MSHKTAMWQIYTYQDHQVVIIQQWQDPFGKPMVRIAAQVDGHVIADGLLEDRFLDVATFVAEQGSEIVEGEN